ncbi:MAG: tyrosine-type recombinase/integrase [Planctomycetes bacterium]|nr:tyrosine-type recombinase/integrase [Planctomycetota bacterium]
MRLLQPTYRDRTGTVRKAPKWYVEFRDHHERIHRLAGFTSRAATEELRRNLEKLVSYFEASGGQVDPTLQRWIDELPRTIRNNLVQFGLVDARRAGITQRLSHFVTQWASDLVARGTTERQSALVAQRVNRIIEGCGFEHIVDIRAPKVAGYLAQLREPSEESLPISQRTSNFYLGAINQFCRWLVKEGHAHANPIAQLEKLTVTDAFERRPLALEEQKHLIKATKNAPDRFGNTGLERAMLYRVALATGFRVSELASLERQSFDLTGDPPTVYLAASKSKNRKGVVQPLPLTLAEDLRIFLGAKASNANALSVPPNYDTAPMLRADLQDARNAWIARAESEQERESRERSDFLKDSTPEGHVDFHSLRHTFGTALAKAGVAPKLAMDLMRHSDINLTMRLYSHTALADRAEA